MSTTTLYTAATLRAMTNDDLEALLDGLVDGTITVPNAGKVYDAALTERYAPHRADRVATLPLTASEAPANAADLALF